MGHAVDRLKAGGASICICPRILAGEAAESPRRQLITFTTLSAREAFGAGSDAPPPFARAVAVQAGGRISGCKSQESELAVLWTIGIFALNFGPVLVGPILDGLGPKWTSVLGASPQPDYSQHRKPCCSAMLALQPSAW